MKKLISFLLVIMLLSSISVSAFATNATLTVQETDDSWNTNGDTLNTPKTELWLQVDATGQIDVTVPLVLVFKTDIDGGFADTASNYKITNNSTAQLAVTNVATAVSDTNTELVAYTATPTEDQYKVQLTANGTSLDLFTANHSKAALEGGLFTLAKAAKNGAGTDTVVKVDMTTGTFSFVTARTAADELDTTKGIKLLTVTYTVAIDTKSAIAGETITDNGDNTVNGSDA